MSEVNSALARADDGPVTAPFLQRLARRARDESGFGLIEVLLSAALLLIGTMGTLALLDRMQDTSGANKARSLAATYAEQDQEQLRELSIADLQTYLTPKTHAVPNTAYTITSQADWLSDASGSAVSCTNGTSQTQYMRISSTVTNSSAGSSLSPVRLVSLVAPTSVGGLAVEVDDRNGTGQANIPVALSGTQAAAGTTNTLGCAVFNSLRNGSFSVRLNTAGYVNPLGNQDVTTSATVSPGTVNSPAPQLYDRAASITATFETKAYGSLVTQASNGASLTVANSGIGNSTGSRTFAAAGGSAASITAPGLFPFKSPYSVYSGSCAANDPANYDTSYVRPAQADPGVATTGIKAFEPALNVVVTKSSAPLANATVKFTPIDSGCTTTFTTTTNSSGKLNDPGVPWGRYDVCVSQGGRFAKKPGVANTSAAGTAVALDLTNASFGSC